MRNADFGIRNGRKVKSVNFEIFRNPYFTFCVRLFIGGIVLYAGLSKITDLADMAQALENYRLLPTGIVNPLAIVLPGVEIVAGLFLMLGFLTRGSLCVATLLIVLFLVGILWAISQGLDIECGCFGTSDAELVGWTVFLRDLLFLFLTIPIWLARKDVPAVDTAFFRQQT